jgi:hypothetical protein
MSANTEPSITARRGRRTPGRAQNEQRLDPYQTQQKPHEPTVCPQCRAVFHNGRWQWGPSPEGARSNVCPACRRIADVFPAGIVTAHAAIALRCKPEIISIARNAEAVEQAEHPLNRIMSIEETEAGLVISTTDIHLPRRIASALKRALRGELDVHFDAAYFVRIDWRPPA